MSPSNVGRGRPHSPAPLDFNADGITDPDDPADYIAAFFAGCG